MDVTTVIIKVASEVVFKALTDDIASIVLKKTTMAKVVFQERLDWLSEFRGLGVFCGETEGIFRRVSSVNTKSLIFVLLALGHKMSHITPNSGLKKKIRERDFWDKKTLVILQLIEDCKIAFGGAGVISCYITWFRNGGKAGESLAGRGGLWCVQGGWMDCDAGCSRVQGWAEQQGAGVD